MAPKLSTIEEQGIVRFVTDTPPTHYAVRIQGFSLLARRNDAYVTEEFEAGKYKWRMSIYPNGNKSRNVYDKISVYLAMAEDSFTNLSMGIYAVFKVSILDQKRDNYYTVQVSNGRHFNKMKLEWGFDEFITWTELNDPSNGFRVGDVCVLGAEVYIREHDIRKAESLKMVLNGFSNKHIWEIDNFSTIATKDVLESMSFQAGDQEWKIRLHPTGFGTGNGTHISIYLAWAGPAILPVATKIFAEFTVRIIDQLNEKHFDRKKNYWFTTSSHSNGWPKFAFITYFNDPRNGFLVRDKCIIEADLTVLGVTTGL